MVITLKDDAVAETLQEFAENQHVTTDEAVAQLIYPLLRIFLHGKDAGIREAGAKIPEIINQAFDDAIAKTKLR